MEQASWPNVFWRNMKNIFPLSSISRPKWQTANSNTYPCKTKICPVILHSQYWGCLWPNHYNDVIMGAMASQITNLAIVYSTVDSCAGQIKHWTTSKFRVTGLCEGISPGTGEFPTQRASKAENVSMWLRHHGRKQLGQLINSPWQIDTDI